jgi:squalene cyclase
MTLTREWMSSFDAIPIDWLLGNDNPAVKYFAMRDLLDFRRTDSELAAAKSHLINYSMTQRILSRQNPDGSWESADRPYLPKYKSSYWQIMFLAMFGLDRASHQVERGVNHILGFQHEEGGFVEFMEEGAKREYEYLSKRDLKHKKGYPPIDEWIPARIREMELSCLTGNMALALIRLGYSDHRAVRDALKWLVEIQNTDGGWLCPYWGAHKNDKHGCFMGTITPLDAFSEAPKKLLNAGAKRSIERGAEFLLMHRLYKADHHNFRPIKKQWLLLTFPEFFYDILRGLSVVTKLGYAEDPRIDDALQVIMNKRLSTGEWPVERNYAGTMYGIIERKGKPSKWMTLEALRVLKRVIQARGYLELAK